MDGERVLWLLSECYRSSSISFDVDGNTDVDLDFKVPEELREDFFRLMELLLAQANLRRR